MKNNHIIKLKEIVKICEKDVKKEYQNYFDTLSILPVFDNIIVGPNCFSEFYSAQYYRNKCNDCFVFWDSNKITKPNNDSGEDIIIFFNELPYLKIIEVKGNKSFDDEDRNRAHVTSALNKSFFNGETKQNSLINEYQNRKEKLGDLAQEKILGIIQEAKTTSLFPDIYAEIHDYTFLKEPIMKEYTVNVDSTLKQHDGKKNIIVNQIVFDIDIKNKFKIEDQNE